MKDFFQYRESLLEARMPSSVSGQIKYLKRLWAGVSSDFVKAGRNGTDFSLSDPDVQKFVDDPDTRYPVIDWKRMSKEDKDLFDYAFEELWYYYEE